ncbi:PBECR4 domain-containing protein [Filifactor villosus]|uniref:PBECR4 domain-containing protein n=1 Tax=Filifactor villosus TaxID=29374 RepID=A0ABV9QIY1_9FIRM
MDKRQAIKIITECAEKYDRQLNNKNFLFLFGETKRPQYIETAFLSRNFMHLTGSGSVSVDSNRFYKLCLDKKLNEENISLYENGATPMKLSILPQLMDIPFNARMIGEFNKSGLVLHTDKLIGNTVATLGFVEDKGYYIPNTALKEDCRNLSSESPKRILAILSKSMTEERYQTITYLAKKLDFYNIKLPDEIEEKIDVLIPFVQSQKNQMKL